MNPIIELFPYIEEEEEEEEPRPDIKVVSNKMDELEERANYTLASLLKKAEAEAENLEGLYEDLEKDFDEYLDLDDEAFERARFRLSELSVIASVSRVSSVDIEFASVLVPVLERERRGMMLEGIMVYDSPCVGVLSCDPFNTLLNTFKKSVTKQYTFKHF